MTYKPLPIGIDDFAKLRRDGYYYVDKTWLIKELLDKKSEINLFTRPRRFGKSLNLSMLRYYFEKPLNGSDPAELFEDLRIWKAGDIYTGEAGQYPVIMLTMKSAKQSSYQNAYACLREAIAREYRRHPIADLLSNDLMREKYILIMNEKASDEEYLTSLAFLSECLYEVYQRQVIILIDEYDVPLENAYYAGFYEKMIAFIRSILESALKSNPFLRFSVVTGCLRISKESIFTGLNNINIVSILNEAYDEHFGFVEEEVKHMLAFYGLEKKIATVREWYDGYRFGDAEVYNPWSVINYVDQLCINEQSFPVPYWSNTSSNSIIKDLIYRADGQVRTEIEQLTNGGTIEKKVHEDITYEDIYASEENLWNFLFYTGYLKQVHLRMEGANRYVTMSIPNMELFYIYENTIETWFRDKIEAKDLTTLYDAALTGNEPLFQEKLSEQLRETISYMDSQESFYHGFLLGLFANLGGYLRKSNREAGDGRYDICIYSPDETRPAIILELKLAEKYRDMEMQAHRALAQIEEKHYDAWLPEEGYTECICYGIAFYKKKCRVCVTRKKYE